MLWICSLRKVSGRYALEKIGWYAMKKVFTPEKLSKKYLIF